ncbi:aminotransferase class I/II-fold pyridoxal phosphate-dependent enzyme [Candidatus Desantisbacteria bacterium]|nr:aminotransferase class I/II-fold pyridoxal phosphate-dependent enzyme [Candidatus Desantisbacteria bacterium]
MENFFLEPADRVKNLPTYLFAAIDKMKSEAVKKGRDVIDLGIGDPDLPTPAEIVESLYISAKEPVNHRYPSYIGMISLRSSIAAWYKKRFGVVLDPETEVLPLIGSKEGIAHIPLAFINPGDVVLFGDPGYPVYPASTILAGGTPHPLPLLKENNFLPILENISADILKKAKLLFVNYPNGITALNSDPKIIENQNKIYKQRRDLMIEGLHRAGFKVEKPKATFYIWMRIPDRYTSLEFTTIMLEKADVVCTPGIGFGKYGEGYVRFSLTVNTEILKKVIERLSSLKIG